jgi:deazaflavin-dependent oxidoreductase (nitroreductase family)
VMKRVAGYLPGRALLETIGRKSGRARRTPLGGRRTGTEYWLVADHGHRSQYVCNLEANPQVRIQIHGRWHDGIAQTVPDDNPADRLRRLPRFNSMLVRSLGTDLLTVRVTLR